MFCNVPRPCCSSDGLIGDTVEVRRGDTTLYIGSLNVCRIRVDEVFWEAVKRRAMRCNAAAIIVAHNHPSGDPTPSPEDVEVTRRLVQAGDLVDIEVLDHLIIAPQRFISLRERGLGFN